MNADTDTLFPGKLLRALRKLESLISSTRLTSWGPEIFNQLLPEVFNTLFKAKPTFQVSFQPHQHRKHPSPFVATRSRHPLLNSPTSNHRLGFHTKIEQADTMVLPVDNPTKSYWIEAADSPLRNFQSTAKLPKKTDIVIIGSGYTGTTSAYWIHKVIPLFFQKNTVCYVQILIHTSYSTLKEMALLPRC